MPSLKKTSEKKPWKMTNLLFLLSIFFISPVWAEDNSLSEKILSSLKIDKSKNLERSSDFDDSITELRKSGYIHRRPDAKKDYSAIWKLLKPIDLFGNRVLVISNEEPGAFIGCCMNDRTEILMEAVGDVGRLRDFAKENRCDLAYDERDDQDTLKGIVSRLKLKSSKAKLVQLSCAAPAS